METLGVEVRVELIDLDSVGKASKRSSRRETSGKGVVDSLGKEKRIGGSGRQPNSLGFPDWGGYCGAFYKQVVVFWRLEKTWGGWFFRQELRNYTISMKRKILFKNINRLEYQLTLSDDAVVHKTTTIEITSLRMSTPDTFISVRKIERISTNSR
jgi:hypothetical protein